MATRVDVSELIDFRDSLDRVGWEYQQDLLYGMKLATLEVEGALREATPHGATGVAQASWFNELDVSVGRIVQTVENKQIYVSVQDRGRAAGPWSSPPPWRSETHGLGLWVKRMLGLQGKRARQAAFLISRKIFRRGISGRHQGFVDDTVSKAIPKVKKILNLTFMNILRKMLS